MNTENYIAFLIIFIISIIQVGLIYNRYFKVFILEYLDNKKSTWNQNYDRKLTFIYISCFVLNLSYSRSLFYINFDNHYNFGFILIPIGFTIIIYLFLNKLMIYKISNTYAPQNECIEKTKTSLQFRTNFESKNYFDNSKTYLTKENDITSTLEESRLVYTKEVSSKGNIKDLNTTQNIQVVDSFKKVPLKVNIKSFNNLFNEEQLKYLYKEFKKNEFISSDYNENEFCKKFLCEKIKLTKKVSSKNLYHIHSKIIENFKVTKEFSLIDFISFFITYSNNDYNYDSVKNGSQNNYSKNVDTIDAIFLKIPNKLSLHK